MYMALLGLLEVPGTLVVTPLGGRFGRKVVGIACAILTSICMATMATIRYLEYDCGNDLQNLKNYEISFIIMY